MSKFKDQCRTCGSVEGFPCLADLCTRCADVEVALEDYLREGKAKARRFVAQVLERAKVEEMRAELIAAIEGEQLTDGLNNESDHAYRAAIRAAVKAVRETPL